MQCSLPESMTESMTARGVKVSKWRKKSLVLKKKLKSFLYFTDHISGCNRRKVERKNVKDFILFNWLVSNN